MSFSTAFSSITTRPSRQQIEAVTGLECDAFEHDGHALLSDVGDAAYL